MHKRMITACLAIAAFAAFVVAPAASASPVLTENGVAVPTGASITGKNTGNTLFTIPGLKPVECTHADLKGTVTANTGTTIAGEVAAGAATFGGTGSLTDCTSSLGDVTPTLISRLCFDTIKATDTVSIDGCNNAKGETVEPITFKLDVTTGTTCAYTANTITGTFKTGSEDATINVVEQEAKIEAGQSFLCPASGKLDMDFDLTTTDNTTLTIS